MLTHRLSRARRALLRIAATAALAAPLVWIAAAEAHDFKLGSIRIDHPYATPTPPGAQTGAVYFRTLINRGRAPDRLIEARASVAGRVELHRMRMDQGVMRMREVDGIDLLPGQAVPARHGQPDAYHLMLFDLKAPLKEGERFSVWLRFRDAGEIEVTAWVQRPKGAAPSHSHQH